jgi:hypothetical protein
LAALLTILDNKPALQGIADIDILRAANLLIKQHGSGARDAADERATELLKAGDADGHATWTAIGRAIGELRHDRRDDEAVQ